MEELREKYEARIRELEEGMEQLEREKQLNFDSKKMFYFRVAFSC